MLLQLFDECSLSTALGSLSNGVGRAFAKLQLRVLRMDLLDLLPRTKLALPEVWTDVCLQNILRVCAGLCILCAVTHS